MSGNLDSFTGMKSKTWQTVTFTKGNESILYKAKGHQTIVINGNMLNLMSVLDKRRMLTYDGMPGC